MIEGIKIVSAEEMARIERRARERGAKEESFIAEAGRQVAAAVMHYVECQGLPKQVTLLVGKGNNGSDAYAAGLCLLEAGYEVHAYSIARSGTPLNEKGREKFAKKGGRFEEKLKGVLLDGLLGTGFKGKVEAEMASLIARANESGLPILSIDIPSGLHGSTGEVGGIAIAAQETLVMGLMKMGFFLREGWNHVGRLRLVDFGLPKEVVAEAEAIGYLPKHIPLPKLVRNRHKYEAGYVVGLGGSKIFAGAPKLAALAALKAGAGLVRLFHLEEIGPVPLEIISAPWTHKEGKEALKKAQGLFLGPGLGQSRKAKAWLKGHLKEIETPCVIDADALLADTSYPKGAILTPHRGEMLRLLGLKKKPREEELLAKVIRFCDQKKSLVVLKGAPTFIFRPHCKPLVVPRGDPGMATAGSGDVLSGVIAGLLAQGCAPSEAAVLGVTLHAIAGEIAAEAKTSYSLVASDLIAFMPDAFRVLMGPNGIV